MTSRATGESTSGILVLGTPRSGTTLLRRLLNAHPAIVSPAETNVFSACARFVREDSIAEGVRVGVVSGLGHAGFARATVMERVRNFAFSFLDEIAVRAGKRRWAEKTAFDAFHIDEIEAICGDTLQYVCLIRNGLDFVASMHELNEKNQSFLPEIHEYVRQYPNIYEAYAHCWVDLTERLLRFADAHPQNALLLRYEDLVHDAESELTRLFGFLEETMPPGLISAAMEQRELLGLGDWKTYGKRTIDPATVGRGTALSAHTRGLIGRIINPTLSRCGYEVIATGTDEDEARRQRRLQLAMLAQGLMGGRPEETP